MRYLKWVSMLTIFAMLFAMLPATVAEDVDIPIELKEMIDEGIETELENVALELEGLKGDLLEYEAGKQTETSLAFNAVDDFVIDEEGVLTRYRGIDRNVVIPDGVKEIGDSAFQNDTLMESVSIPNSVTYIGDGAFSGCTALTSVVIPDSVTETDSYVFADCSGLVYIQLSGNMKRLSKGFFYGCTSLKSVILPDGMTEIRESAFYDCEGLESVTIPANVTGIDRDAFNGSSNVVIRGSAGTYAEQYATSVGIPFNAPVVTIVNPQTEIDQELILCINHSFTLSATQQPADLARTLDWSSSDTGVVTVDQNGTIMGISEGTAVITAATADGRGKAGKIGVFVPKSTEIQIRSYGGEITLDQTMYIEADKYTPLSYETGIEMPITWSSSDSSIIEIVSVEDDKITVKGKKPGTATITAATPDGGMASEELKVVRPRLESITLGKAKYTLGLKEKLTLKVNLIPTEASTTLTWLVRDPEIVSISKKGVVTAKKVGETTIAVVAENGISAEATITVKAAPKEVSLNKSGTVTLAKGKKLKLKAKLPKNTASALTWKSSKPRVASVDQKGVVTALKKGAAVITVKTFNGKTAKVTIKVK